MAAEPDTQSVFADVASRPQIVPDNAVLAGWLYRHSCFKACQKIRDESRRRKREQIAAAVHSMNVQSSDPWASMLPLLDDLMMRLKQTDRDALVVRFFHKSDLRSVGIALGISEDAAQKRVSRALDALRALFMQRGAAFSVVGLGAALESHATVQVPLTLTSVLTKPLVTGLSQSGMLADQFSRLTGLKISSLALAGLLAVATLSFLWRHLQQNNRPRSPSIQKSENLEVTLKTFISGTKQRYSAAEFLVKENGMITESWACLRVTATDPTGKIVELSDDYKNINGVTTCLVRGLSLPSSNIWKSEGGNLTVDRQEPGEVEWCRGQSPLPGPPSMGNCSGQIARFFAVPRKPVQNIRRRGWCS